MHNRSEIVHDALFALYAHSTHTDNDTDTETLLNRMQDGNHNIKTDNKSFENVVQLKYSGITARNQDCINE
jgi:hypothetical protein